MLIYLNLINEIFDSSLVYAIFAKILRTTILPFKRQLNNRHMCHYAALINHIKWPNSLVNIAFNVREYCQVEAQSVMDYGNLKRFMQIYSVVWWTSCFYFKRFMFCIVLILLKLMNRRCPHYSVLLCGKRFLRMDA